MNDDAHANAVEAAARVRHERKNARLNPANQVVHSWEHVVSEPFHAPYVAVLREDAEATITAYLAAMRAEGWVMVRDVGGAQPATVPWRYGDAWDGIQDGVGIGTLDALCNGYADGWNACRVAMLKGAGDGQG